MNDDQMLTIEEAAQFLKMTPKQVYELCRARSQERMEYPFPAFSIHSKAKRVRKSHLMAWIDALASRVPVGDSMMSEHSIPLQQDGNCRRPVTDGQSPLDVCTGFEDEGYLVPMLVSCRADDIDSKFPIDPQGDVLLFNFSHERPSEILQCVVQILRRHRFSVRLSISEYRRFSSSKSLLRKCLLINSARAHTGQHA